MENKLLQTLLETLITVFVPILASLAAMYLNKLFQQAKQQISEDQFKFAERIISQLVKAAEQTGLKDELMKDGATKKAWVISNAEAYLETKGIKLDLATLSALIESEVLDNFNWNKLEV